MNLPEQHVPSTFLVADIDGQIVGRVTIRHELNDFLRVEGGHIGYCVLPGFRRRGYATEILRQALIVARSIGIDRVLVTCDDDNAASIAVIEANGGKLDARPAGHRRRSGAPALLDRLTAADKRLLAQGAHDLAAFGTGQRVDVQLALQMIGLVLQAAGEVAVAGDGHRLLIKIDAGDDGVGGPSPVGADARNGQAGLAA